MKTDGRVSKATSNMLMIGKQLRQTKREIIERFKRKTISKLEAQKHALRDDMNMEECGWKTRENDAYDMAIKIINESTPDRLSRS